MWILFKRFNRKFDATDYRKACAVCHGTFIARQPIHFWLFHRADGAALEAVTHRTCRYEVSVWCEKQSCNA
jgi:hypothetical protein